MSYRIKLFSKKIPHEILQQIPTRDIAYACDVHERTARQWKEKGIPTAEGRLLALAIGDLEAIAGPAWKHWTIDYHGRLISPDGTIWHANAPAPASVSDRRDQRSRRGRAVLSDPNEIERIEHALASARRISAELARLSDRAESNIDREYQPDLI